ncbi:MAG: D-alanine--D-alanine ligase family protein [Syntrophothermus sp.]
MKEKLKVAVVFNEAHPDFYQKHGSLDEKDLGFIPYFEVDDMNPIEEYELMAQKLAKFGYDAYTVNIKDDLNILINDCKEHNPDVIFNFVELFNDNARHEMNVVGVIDLLRIPFTGAPPIVLANCQNKTLAKKILNAEGISTPNFKFYEISEYDNPIGLKYPLIVKPAFEDASVGIENESIVYNVKNLNKRLTYVYSELNQPALVEEFIDGRELNVAVLGDKDPQALPISEIDFSAMPNHLHNIVSYQAKWDPKHEAYHKTIPICPAKLPKEIELKAKEIAVQAFKTMECRDYARVDIRLSKDNELYVLEVNPNPDLTESAGFMRSAEATGMTYEEALSKIIELAYERREK